MSTGIDKDDIYERLIRTFDGPFRVDYARISIDGDKVCSVGHNRRVINENLRYLVDNIESAIATYGDPDREWHTLSIFFFRYGAKKTYGRRKVVAYKEVLIKNSGYIGYLHSWVLGCDRSYSFDPDEPRGNEDVLLVTRIMKQRDLKHFPYTKEMLNYIKEYEVECAENREE